MTTYEHRLAGCRPEPLGSYLKALGVLRLVAEQADPTAVGRWEPDGFVLDSVLDDVALARFFLHHYHPTPLVSPWNNSSGFGPEGAGQLHLIERSTGPRLEPYRKAIEAARAVLADALSGGWPKEHVLAACRSRLPDACVPWLDAAAVLTSDRAVYPPLLGTGGNDGRLEFSRNFHQRVLDVLGLTHKRGHDPGVWLEDALYDLGRGPGMRGPSPGQFDAGAAGGNNSGPGGAADSVLNPWDWVLLLEGSLLLASGSARRLAATGSGRAAAPFTVEASAGGYASASEAESNRGEFWAPLWSRPVGLSEVRKLFSEGRADWRKGHARSGLDLAKAAVSLGVDRGISAFSRHAFVERYGLSTVAVPTGRIAVRERKEVAPLAELDRWLDRVRRGRNPPATVVAGLRAVDRASFELASRGGPDRLLGVLSAAARLEAAVGLSSGFRDRANVPPISGLDGPRWLAALDPEQSGSEFRLAVCLASGRDTMGAGPGCLRQLLRPLAPGARGRLEWTPEPARVPGLGSRLIHQVLAAAHARRAVDVQQRGDDDRVEVVGVATHFATARKGDLVDVANLAAGRIDPRVLEEAFIACLLLDWSGSTANVTGPTSTQLLVPPAFAVLGPFFGPQPMATADAARSWRRRLQSTALLPEAEWPALLAADRLPQVLDLALRRLRIARLRPVLTDGWRMAPGPDPGAGAWLGAALLCRVSGSVRTSLLNRICPDPDPSSGQQEEPEHSSLDPNKGDSRARS